MICILLAFSLKYGHVSAEESVRILMLEDPNAPRPSDTREDLGSVYGRVFFRGKTYRGFFTFSRDSNGLYVINTMPLETYIQGVVAAETGEDWEYEALKAQAVASRTYAVFQRNNNKQRDFHLTSGVLHQVYRDNNVSPRVIRSVKETAGEILTYIGLPISAFYHSTCKGKTELPSEVWNVNYPYLKSVECNTGDAPYDAWSVEFTLKEIGEALGVKGIIDIGISSPTATGRVKTLRYKVTEGTGNEFREIKATELRRLLGYRRLPSTDFILKKEAGKIIMEGKGWGHGVGLSQWGALEMARQGKDYREILAHYYPGTKLHQLNERR